MRIKYKSYNDKMKLIITDCKRASVVIKYSKNGVEQECHLRFNKGRLLTDESIVRWGKPLYLKSVLKLKTIDDVLNYLYEFSFSPNFVKITTVTDLMENSYSRYKRIQDLIDFNLDVLKLKGIIYWGEYGIEFENGYVTFNTIIPKKSLGTFQITGKRDLINITIKIVGHLHNELNYFKLLKNIEVEPEPVKEMGWFERMAKAEEYSNMDTFH